MKYINGLGYTIQEHVALHDVFSVDEAHNNAMKIKRLQSRAQLFRRQLSIEEPVKGDGVQPSSMTTGQPLIQPTTKASTLTPTSQQQPQQSPRVNKILALIPELASDTGVVNLDTSPMSAQREDRPTRLTIKKKTVC